MANTNLTSQASVILNEVVSNNRSTLAGFTEVLGGKADVVLANPVRHHPQRLRLHQHRPRDADHRQPLPAA